MGVAADETEDAVLERGVFRDEHRLDGFSNGARPGTVSLNERLGRRWGGPHGVRGLLIRDCMMLARCHIDTISLVRVMTRRNEGM